MLANVTVRRGFPLKVWFDMVQPDPDAGYKGGVAIDRIETVKGRDASFLKLTADEMDEIAAECAYSLCREVW